MCSNYSILFFQNEYPAVFRFIDFNVLKKQSLTDVDIWVSVEAGGNNYLSRLLLEVSQTVYSTCLEIRHYSLKEPLAYANSTSAVLSTQWSWQLSVSVLLASTQLVHLIWLQV